MEVLSRERRGGGREGGRWGYTVHITTVGR